MDILIYIHTHLCNLKIKRKTGRKYNSWIWLSQRHYLGEIDNPVMVYQKWNAIVVLFLAIKNRRKHYISHLFWKGHVVKKQCSRYDSKSFANPNFLQFCYRSPSHTETGSTISILWSVKITGNKISEFACYA